MNIIIMATNNNLPLITRGPNWWFVSPYLNSVWQSINNWIKETSRRINIPQNLDKMWRKIVQTYNNVINSPEVQYAKDSWQFQEMARINADNHIWPARENVVYNLNQYQRTSPSWSDRWVAADSLDKAVDNYNAMLKQYWSNTSWWPMNNKWEYHWQDYARYIDNRYDAPIQYEYTVEWDKGNVILNWQQYEPQKFKFETQSWVDLLNQMSDLTKQYNELEALEKTVRPQWNALREQWKWDTKEAREYLDQWSKYNEEKIKVFNTLRQARDNYYNLVNNYWK